MKNFKTFESFVNESVKKELYVVEEKSHTVKINGKPVYHFDFWFFIDKREALDKSKELKAKWEKQIGEAIIRVYKPDNMFDWLNINQHKGISFGVEKNGWMLHGGTKMKNPSTGKSIIVDMFLDKEVGDVAKLFFGK